MNRAISFAFVPFFVLILLALVLRAANAAPQLTNAVESARQTRACVFPAGGWAIVNCSNSAAASSSQLTAWSRYIMQCGDDSYFAPGIAASGVDADSNDGWIPAGAWLEFLTTDTIRYMSVLNKNSDSDCRIIECQ
jgi:hypothetical protein